MRTVTLLEPDIRSSFLYRMEGGMDDRDREELEAMDSGYVLGMDWPSIVSDSVDVRHRVHYMRQRRLGFGLIGPADPVFKETLEAVDPRLPSILGRMVSDLYLNGTRMLSDHIENTESEAPRGSGHGWCAPVIDSYLRTLGYEKGPERCFLFRVPAGLGENFEVYGTKNEGFTARLVFGIGYEE